MQKFLSILLLGAALAPRAVLAQEKAVVTIHAQQKGAPVSPVLHGIFFEEISHAGEGGLYAELIQNRGFEEANLPQGTHLEDGFIVPERTPHFMLQPGDASDWKMEWPLHSQWPAWSSEGNISLALTTQQPLNNATPHSLEIKATGPGSLANEGFWGINAVAGNKYDLKCYVRNGSYKGPFTVSLQSADGTILASREMNITGKRTWQKYTATLTPVRNDTAARFVISFGGKGTLWLDFVSLFPENTFRHRPNGLRADLAQYLADLKPAFIRWPGGCYVEGINIQSAPDWKRTLGPVEQRPGTYSPWGYWSSDGFGYHEYLQFCEDIGAAALYVFNVGVSCEYRSGTYLPDDSLQATMQNALDAIEYAIGPVTSKWGAKRAAAGHPAPFPLRYVEIGNEQHGPRYAKRYNVFYDAIHARYPQLHLIASMGIGDVNRHTLDSMQHTDIVDEHAYKGASWSFNHYDHFDNYKRGNWEMYVGEYATNAGVGAGNMAATLSDAVYMMSMEKNSDLVKMCSYAPLLVNVHDVDWPVNLINFDAAHSFARISYYAIQLFNENKPTVNLATDVQRLVPEQPVPAFSGGIGLGTWDTESEYKDITVTQNGQVTYQSNFAQGAGPWEPVRGTWKLEDSAFSQTAEGAQQFAWLKGRSFDTYTLTLKARKKDGTNAFIIPFAVKDSNTYLRAHIGAYVNATSVFERVTGGYDVSNVTDHKPLPAPVEKGRWYNIRLEVKADEVDCYLDDQLLMTYREPPKVFVIAGADAPSGDIIIKAVNAGAAPCVANFKLPGVEVLPTATLISLHAPSDTVENSFAHPTAYIPQQSEIHDASADFNLELAPYAINVLRLHRAAGK